MELGTWYLVVVYRGNGGIRRGIYQLQGEPSCAKQLLVCKFELDAVVFLKPSSQVNNFTVFFQFFIGM